MAKEKFRSLVSGMEDDERKDLLQKVAGKPSELDQLPIDEENIVIADKQKNRQKSRQEHLRDITTKLKSESLFRRIYFWFKSVFSNSTPAAVYTDYLIENIADRIEWKAPGLLSFKRGRFLTAMYTYLISMRDAAVFFRPLIAAIDYDVGAFYVFACRRVIPDFERKYNESIDPQWLSNDTELTPQLRVILLQKLEDMLSSMTDTDKNRLSELFQSFLLIRQIGVMPFKRFSAMFVKQGNQQVCLFPEVRAEVTNIAKVVCGSSVINDSLLDILNDYYAEAEKAAPADVRRPQDFLEHGNKHFSAINNFLSHVPMNLVGAVVYYDIEWMPPAPEIVDNWLSVLKSRWRDILNESWDATVLRRRGLEFGRKINEAFNTELEKAPVLANRPWTIFSSVRFKDDYPIGFLDMYFSSMYVNYRECLNTLAVEGEFLKVENRIEFTESLSTIKNEIAALGDLNRRLMNGTGEYSETLSHLKVQNMVNKKKLDVTMQKISSATSKIISNTTAAFMAISSVLGGVFSDKRNPQYLGMSNTKTIQGTSNAEFMQELTEANASITAALLILQEMSK
ncbi:MAG: hypothetical protein Ta2A_03130 [Treponemataceae bacterium]|nr:MAG: hypothetical protein Ta2A_03130 [Treponemataceae bacterium]